MLKKFRGRHIICKILLASIGGLGLFSALSQNQFVERLNGKAQTELPRLPLPASVEQARLAELRPLTHSGRAGAPLAWSPDGQEIAYTELARVPGLFDYAYSTTHLEPQVWMARADGSTTRRLANGWTLFYSPDGAFLYFRHLPLDESPVEDPSVWRIEMTSGKTQALSLPKNFLSIQPLADGRMTISKFGTYAPLEIFDPAENTTTPLMAAHPSNSPQDARLSPDGTLLAYPEADEMYLAQADGTHAQALSTNGGFSARVWWSPDSQFLAYTTGNHWKDRLVLADRGGKTLSILIPKFEESGHISYLAWSPDSRWMLVATDPYERYSRPTRLFLFDKEGKSVLLLEAYLRGMAWSPDGHTLALAIWRGVESTQITQDVWLAALTDTASAAPLPPVILPTEESVPAPALPPADLSPEAVVTYFWAAINARDYPSAMGAMVPKPPQPGAWYEFQAYYACIDRADVDATQPISGDAQQQILRTSLLWKKNPTCDNGLWEPPGAYVVLVRADAASPWLIACFNSQPDCEYHGP